MLILSRFEMSNDSTHNSTILHDVLADPDCELETVKKILVTADINAPNMYGTVPLHVALLNPNCKPEIIRLLILRGASVDAENYVGDTSLHIAVQNTNCKSEIIEILLGNGAKVYARDFDNNIPLHHAARNPSFNLEVIKLLLDAGSSMIARNYLHDTPLVTALKNPNCSIDIVKILLRRCCLTYINFDCLTPLQIYLQNPNCNVEIVRELIDRGSPLSIRYVDGSSMLHHIVKISNCYPILSEMLMKSSTGHFPNDRIDINCTDDRLNTPLHVALEFNYTDSKVISLLLKCGANVNAANNKGEKPLNKALQHFYYNLSIFNELIKYGADIVETTVEFYSPLRILLGKYRSNPIYYRPCAELFLKYGIKKSFEDHVLDPDFHGYNLDIILCPDIIYNEYGKVLSKFIDSCCHELVRMKTDLLQNKFSLYDFICKRKCRPSGITKDIVIVLTYNNYPIYYDCVVEYIDEAELLTLVKNLHVCTNYSQVGSVKKGKQIVLNSVCVDNIVSYLCKRDLLSFIIAFYGSLNHSVMRSSCQS